jgi:hypothetical protein
MAMAYGLVGPAPPVAQGTVIALTPEELTGDVKDIANNRIKAEYEANTGSQRKMSKFESRKKIKQRFEEGSLITTAPAYPIDDVKHRIRMLSLFPNTVNSKMTYRKDETGAYRSGMAGV